MIKGARAQHVARALLPQKSLGSFHNNRTENIFESSPAEATMLM